MTRGVPRRLGLALVGLCLLTGLFPDMALAKPYTGPTVLAQSVTVRESPPRITLQWQNLPGAGG